MNKLIEKGYLIRLAVLLLCAILSLSCLAACDGNEDLNGENGGTEQEGDGNGSSDNGNDNGNENKNENENENASSGNEDNESSSGSGDGTGEGGTNGSGLPTIEFPPIPFD